MLARKKRPAKAPLPIPAEDQAEIDRLGALARGKAPLSPEAQAFFRFREAVWQRTGRCVHCGWARQGRRLCRDCYRA